MQIDPGLMLDNPNWSPDRALLQLDAFGVPALFHDIQGTWQGTYYKVNAQAEKIKDFEGAFTIIIEGDRYTQTNRYQFTDGSTLELQFSGIFDNGILSMASTSRSQFRAQAWQAGPNLILFDSMKQEGKQQIRYLETIYFDSPTSRSRTTLEYRDGQFFGVNFIREVKAER